MKGIQFRDRKVKILSMHQWRTYRSVTDGLPDEQFNQELIDRLPDEAMSLTFIKSFHLIKPKIQPLTTHVGKREKLPPVICIMGLQSHEQSTGRDGFSELTLIWFQEEFCFPIADEIMKEIRKLDWSSKCIDYTWEDL